MNDFNSISESDFTQQADKASSPSLSPNLGKWAIAVPTRKLEWLWKGWIPKGKLVIVDGDPGLGKSTLYCADIPARVSTGSAMPFDSECEESKGENVLIISVEDDAEDTLIPRLMEAGADLNRIILGNGLIQHGDRDQILSIKSNIAAIRDEILTHDIALVVLDPLVALLGANVNYDQEVREALAPLQAILQETGAACIGIRHMRKAITNNAIHKGGGSIGIAASARVQQVVARSKENPEVCVLAVAKCNLSTLPKSLLFRVVSGELSSKIEWLGETGESANDLVSDLPSSASSPIGEALDMLRDELSEGPVKVARINQLATERGISTRTLNRAKKELGVVSTKHGYGEGSWHEWSLTNTNERRGGQT